MGPRGWGFGIWDPLLQGGSQLCSVGTRSEHSLRFRGGKGNGDNLLARSAPTLSLCGAAILGAHRTWCPLPHGPDTALALLPHLPASFLERSDPTPPAHLGDEARRTGAGGAITASPSPSEKPPVGLAALPAGQQQQQPSLPPRRCSMLAVRTPEIKSQPYLGGNGAAAVKQSRTFWRLVWKCERIRGSARGLRWQGTEEAFSPGDNSPSEAPAPEATAAWLEMRDAR